MVLPASTRTYARLTLVGISEELSVELSPVNMAGSVDWHTRDLSREHPGVAGEYRRLMLLR